MEPLTIPQYLDLIRVAYSLYATGHFNEARALRRMAHRLAVESE